MSEAKRNQSAFQQSRSLGRALARRNPAGSVPCVAPNFAELRVLESWESKVISSHDPYNGMGARAGARHSPRK
jgi:hypothetical protein